MKSQLNYEIKRTGMKVDEENLFREMAKEFNTTISKATYVEVIHKNSVEFSSCYKVGGVAKVELGDLMLLTYDKARNELRICILQAKYKKGRYYYFLNFHADIFQWELLKEKPFITNKSKRFNFPSNILNFRDDYDSITAYGIFYEDNISREIDFLYTLPKHIEPRNYPKGRITNGVRSFYFRCPKHLGSPNSMCKEGITPKEAISTCSLDVFEEQVLRCKVGAPINDAKVKNWVARLLVSYKGSSTMPEVIDDLLEYLDVGDDYIDEVYDFEGIPSVMVVVTDSDKIDYEISKVEYFE